MPWDWIVDETREVTGRAFAPTVAEYVRDLADQARIDCWDGQPPPLLCESRTFGGVLKRTIAPAYLCPVAATNGQVGGVLSRDVTDPAKGTPACANLRLARSLLLLSAPSAGRVRRGAHLMQ